MLQQAQEIRGRALLAHANPDARPLRAEAPDERGEEAGADALVDPDLERPGGALGESGHVRAGRVESRDDRIGVAELGLDNSGWTELEREVLTEHRWWSAAALRAASEQIYPEDLAELLEAAVQG